MHKQIIKKNSNGYTLVEVLAAVTILSIILVAFIPVFPQVLSWANKNETNLVANNVAEVFIDDLKKDMELITSNKGNLQCDDSKPYPAGNREKEIQGTTYTSDLTVCQSAEEKEIGLYRFNIKIYEDSNTNHLIDTYFYLAANEEMRNE